MTNAQIDMTNTQIDLASSTLFSGLTPLQIQKLLQNTPHHLRTYQKNETIFYFLEPAHTIAILLKGQVQAQKTIPNGSQINVSSKNPGEILGSAAAFSKNNVYPCDVVAVQTSELLLFERTNFLQLLQSNTQVLSNFVSELSSLTYQLQLRIELLSYKGIAQKAAFWLLMQSAQNKSARVELPFSITQWARILNVSRTSLHRELKRLEERKIIVYSKDTIDIKNRAQLQAVLD